jgi:hypothetical protein
MRLRWALPLLVVLGSSPAASEAAVRLPAPGMLGVDGSVYSITPAGSRIVVTGRFDSIGQYVGGGAAVDQASGALDRSFPQVHGQVSDVVVDGSGGWYIGGRFDRVGTVRANNVAHLLPGGEADPSFRSPRALNFVSALEVVGDRLYAANFGYGNEPVMVLEATTGRRKDATFKPESWNHASEILVVGTRLYVGGERGVRAIDALTGATEPTFDCDACKNPGRVTALYNGPRGLYVGTTRGGVFRVDAATGKRDPGFAPSPNTVTEAGPDVGPLDFEPVNGRLVVGGRDLGLGGPSSTLVALDMETGAADPDYAAGFTAPLHDLGYQQGGKFVAGGAPFAGRPPVLFTLDTATGAVLERAETEFDGAIDAVTAVLGRPYIGGRFRLWNKTPANDVAVLDAASGLPVPGFSMVNHPEKVAFNAPLVLGDRLVYRLDATSFKTNHQRLRLVAYSLRTGQEITGFAPKPIFYDPRTDHQWLEAIVRSQGDRIFVGHNLGDPSTTWPGATVHVLDGRTGAQTHRYDIPFDGYLTDLLPVRDRLIATGSFRRFFPDGRPRHLATVAMNPLTGEVDDAFDAHTNGPVYSVAGVDDRLFLDGLFTRSWGLRRPGLTSVFSTLPGYPVRDFRPALTGGPPVALDGHLLSVDFSGYVGARMLDPYTGDRVKFDRREGGRIDLLTTVRGRLYASVSSGAYYDPESFVGFLPPVFDTE